MPRIIFVYGPISGLVIIVLSLFVLPLTHHASVWLGYLIMLVALSSILVGVRQYRDQSLGGVIRFTTALALGLGIALASSLIYMLSWEVYLAFTHYRFMDDYAAHMLAAKRAAGVTGAAYQHAVAQAEQMKRDYANPLLRLGETFMEIFPVGVLIALVSAVLLRL